MNCRRLVVRGVFWSTVVIDSTESLVVGSGTMEELVGLIVLFFLFCNLKQTGSDSTTWLPIEQLAQIVVRVTLVPDRVNKRVRAWSSSLSESAKDNRFWIASWAPNKVKIIVFWLSLDQHTKRDDRLYYYFEVDRATRSCNCHSADQWIDFSFFELTTRLVTTTNTSISWHLKESPRAENTWAWFEKLMVGELES